MSKLFWSVLMFFSLIITAWSGFFIYNELQSKEMADVPLVPVAPVVATPTPVSTSTATASTQEATTPTSQPPAPEPSEEKPKAKRINGKEVIDFTYTNSAAKKVYLVGDFNKWYRQPMKREGDQWTIAVPLAAGKYQYVFVVDDGKTGPAGKRLPDPKNDQKSKDGKLSLLTVKPSSEAK